MLRAILTLRLAGFITAAQDFAVHDELVDFDVILSPGSPPSRFTVRVRRDWAPKGAKRFVTLVKSQHYDNCAFFRVIQRFMAQFGISGNTTQQATWRHQMIEDETLLMEQRGSNVRGTMTFAHAGPNTRSTQLFINLVDNKRLDGMNFPPIAEVIKGMEVVDAVHLTGEGAPSGPGPSQGMIQRQGDEYLLQEFPYLSRIVKARLQHVKPDSMQNEAHKATRLQLNSDVTPPNSKTRPQRALVLFFVVLSLLGMVAYFCRECTLLRRLAHRSVWLSCLHKGAAP